MDSTNLPNDTLQVALACPDGDCTDSGGREGEWPHHGLPGAEMPDGDMPIRTHHISPPYEALRDDGLRDLLDVAVLRCQDPVSEVPRLLRAMGGEPVPVVVTSPAAEPERIVRAFQSGATSYLVEGDYPPCLLQKAVLGAATGHMLLSPIATRALLETVLRGGPEVLGEPPATSGEGEGEDGDGERLRAVLSRRERQIMELLSTGLSAQEIGLRLRLREKTVRNNLSNIYAKLDARGSTDAVLRWLRASPGNTLGSQTG
ncbi:LuxR C-terminal-related transcriptional regulator [Streptomyces sp. 2A115]|uniref:LuxR C-terminal-related transcriptional regulator n=1 Tax=Streptomyces sp. 2A115 TaxID=3457439 RepID=UPI003FCFED01